MSQLPPGFVLDNSGPVFGPPPSRSKMRQEDRADRGENRADRTADVSIADTAHDNAITDRRNRLDLPQTLRREFAALPEVRDYATAAQQLSQALNTGKGAQADLALTYAFAKAMDPNSVVREAEQAMVTGSQPIAPGYVENLRKQLGADDAGNYTDKTRANLRQQIIRSVASRRQLYEQARNNFSENARRNGIDPAEVIGPHAGDAYRAQARAYDQQRRAAGATLSDTGTGVGRMTGGMLSPPPRKASRGWWEHDSAPRKAQPIDDEVMGYINRARGGK